MKDCANYDDCADEEEYRKTLDPDERKIRRRLYHKCGTKYTVGSDGRFCPKCRVLDK